MCIRDSYYTVTDAKSAVYEIANFIQGIEQLTVTTLRNVIGSLDLEETLTSVSYTHLTLPTSDLV